MPIGSGTYAYTAFAFKPTVNHFTTYKLIVDMQVLPFFTNLSKPTYIGPLQILGGQGTSNSPHKISPKGAFVKIVNHILNNH